ncbi:MAG TPA: rhomboid family intramembrane serine protease [Candidatus Nanopelagicaceae bacterium]
MKRNATTALITIICGFYLLQLIDPSIQEHLFLINKAILSDGAVHGVATGEWYRILTVALVHGGFLHLAFNMWALFVLGNPIEQAFGRYRFLAIFFISLIAGSLTSLVLSPVNQPSVGASGALFGLFGALAVTGRRIGVDVRSILVLIGINFALGFMLPNIDWHAHLGGLIGGAIAATVLLRKRV